MIKILILTVVLILPITLGFIYSQNSKNMQIYYSSKDLPEQGLIIIKPSDPEFDILAANLLSKQNILGFEKLKPFSLFLKNNSSKAVVAHTILWRFVDSERQVIERNTSYVNSPALADGILDAETDGEYNETIAAGGYKFITIAPKNHPRGGGGGSAEYTNEERTSKPTQSSDVIEKGQKELNLLYSDLLKDKSEVLIILDGVFFEDGLFVGSDETGFFNIVDAHVRAKRDIVSFVNENLKNSVSAETLDNFLKSKSEIKPKNIGNQLNPENQYDHTTKIFAKHFSKIQQLLGREGLLNEINDFNKRSLPQIRKL